MTTATIANGPVSLMEMIGTANGEAADIRPAPFTHPAGTVIAFDGYGHYMAPRVIVGYQDPNQFGTWTALTVDPESPTRIDTVHLLHPHGTRRGIGHYESAPGTGIVTPGEVERLRSAAQEAMGAESDARKAAEAKRSAEIEAGRALVHLLGDAPCILVAEWREDESDSMTDYYGHRTVRRAIVGLLKSTRVNFKAWKKVAAQHASPEIAACAQGEEHRQTYSMGGGYFITAPGAGSHHGLALRAWTRPASGWGADVLGMFGRGEHPWASTEPTPPGPNGPSKDEAPAADEPTPAATAQESVDVEAAPSAGTTLTWRPEHGKQAAALRSVGLDVAALRAAGFKWGRYREWEADDSAEARAILVRLGVMEGAKEPEAKPVAETALDAALRDAGLPGGDNGVADLRREADRAVEQAGRVVAGIPADLHAKADVRLSSLVERARKLADRLDAKAAEKEGPRDTGTPKRLAQAMHARLEAARWHRGAALLRAWAEDPSRLPSWRPNIEDAIDARARELQQVANGWHSYHVDGDALRATNDPTVLALRAAYPEEAAAPDPRAKLERLEAAIRFSPIHGFFPTPPSLIRRIIDLADVQQDQRVLEPSAGNGALAEAAQEAGGAVVCCEINGALREILTVKGFTVIAADFMDWEPRPVQDRIVANPPFERGQDRDHIRRMYDHLAPGGRLVSVCSTGPFFRTHTADVAFREWLDRVGAEVEDVEPGAFSGSDAFRKTGVSVKLVLIDKPFG